MKTYQLLALLMTALVFGACQQQHVPSQYKQSEELPLIYPDYINVTVPINIAPLTFELEKDAETVITRFSCGDKEIVCAGKAQPDANKWQELKETAKGQSIQVEIYAQQNEQWMRYKPFNIYVSSDSIDPYISYRLISPSYVTYEELTINQRCLENYKEQVIYDNMLCSTEESGQCINCHNYQMYDPQRMQFHARQNLGGTVIAYDGKVEKINMKNDSILSAGVYPAWHPWLKLIVYSTNKTGQSFHTRDLNKIEVFDAGSDLIVFDIDHNQVSNIENAPDELEVFPCWAPDGKTLYYCSAHFEYNDSLPKDAETIMRAKEIKYSIYKKSFDPETLIFGPRELVYDAAGMDMSATLPRVSPDGKYLLFTLGHYGCFHIWHHEADLWLLNLETSESRAFDEVNSPDTESYHSWSSNGRWIIFSSRRDDGGYTRLFIAHVDANGKATKPFEVPQADPNYNREFMKSYNIPEFMKGAVTLTPAQVADVLKGDGRTPVEYVSKLKKQ